MAEVADEVRMVEGLDSGDLDEVVALDRQHSTASRRGFFDKRFQAMVRHPESFIALKAECGGKLAGFVLAHLLEGEFGAQSRVVVLDAIAVAADAQCGGVGIRLMSALEAQARTRGATEMRTRVRWGQPGLVDFFARSGFELAPRMVLERTTAAAEF